MATSACAAAASAETLRTAEVAIKRADFGDATKLTPFHRGLNVNLLEDSNLRWDAATKGNTGFADVASMKSFRDLVKGLGVGSFRVPGGTASNYYDYDSNKAWLSWAIQSSSQYNRAPAISWSTFWGFHADTGSLPLMNTANVYKRGSPNQSNNWITTQAAEHWVTYYKTQKITGSNWETGNEVYASNQTPSLEYPGSRSSSGKTYLSRACSTAAAIKKSDPTAKVGLVVYEHESSSGYPVLDQAASFCGLEAFDFFVLHDYAPLYPSSATSLTFPQEGVERALAYQNLTHTVHDFELHLRKKHASVASRPIYVTEYGLLSSGDVNLGQTDWYNKPVSLLLLNHYLNLVAQGAAGAWYWDAVHPYFRVIDPNSLTVNNLYKMLAHAFEQRGRLRAIDVTGSGTFDVKGPIGSGCLEGEAESKCWHVALASGKTLSKLKQLKVYASLKEHDKARKLTITVINFGASEHLLNLVLSDFDEAGYKSTFAISKWQLAGTSWDTPLEKATTSTSSASNVKGASRVAGQAIAGRSVTVFEIAM